ncbi:cache domain-containing sensor histidine kinase [Neobacillus cucumis]|uniref:cache domain-containing sensor histidine kinase n=1 Tax=Neobacillus cucumis TaxID=1740721 RepID=UPI0028533775|nr:sensor histidine kinase [Neobacillus cucumis]MDR4946136.1 sensor histidine kinase [Neobacillus cucumis]
MISKLLENIKLKNSRLSTKLIITYILLTVIPMGLLGVLAYYEYTKSIEEKVGEYIPKLLKQANNNIENSLSELERLPELIYSSSDVMSVLRDSNYKNQSRLHQDQFVVESFLTNTYLDNSSEILGAFLLSKNRSFVSTRIPYEGFNLENLSLPYGEEHDLGEKVTLILPKQASLKFDGDPPYILLMKQVTDFDNRKSLGTLFLAVKLSFIKDVLADLEEEKNATMWVMNEDGQVIYHTNASKIGSVFSEIKSYPLLNGSFQTGSGKEKTLISVNKSTRHKWIIVHSIPLKYLTMGTDMVRNVTVLAFFILVVISSLISVFLAWTVTKPIKKLGNLMQDVKEGNLSVSIPIDSKDEVGVLAQSFDSMLTEIRDLIRKNYSIEIRQKNAELYALQSQINPHFMYNTLQTISMAVEDGESETVIEMVTLLGRMLRYSLSNKERLVPISQEVDHIQDYLKIQKFRFEERITYKVQTELDSGSYYTPKFILQPLVENSIKYGLEKRKGLTINIDVKEILNISGQKDILFTVSDNGPGINHEKLEELNYKLKSDPMGKRDSGFGILNVHARVMMMFGNQYELKVTSSIENGTGITIQIPAISKNDVSSYFAIQGDGDGK